MNEACWKGYKQIGMKKKGGRTVPNCVKENKFSFAEWLNENKETDNKFFLSLVDDAKHWIPLSDREAKEFWQNETDLVDRWGIEAPQELHKVKLEVPLDHIEKLKNYDDSKDGSEILERLPKNTIFALNGREFIKGDFENPIFRNQVVQAECFYININQKFSIKNIITLFGFGFIDHAYKMYTQNKKYIKSRDIKKNILKLFSLFYKF